MKEQKKGISLIVLVITIIVMLILASAVIISLSNSNIINKAKEAVTKTDIKNFEQELSISLADKKLEDRNFNMHDVNETDIDNLQEYIPSLDSKYGGKIAIKNGELVYVNYNVTEEEKEALESIGITSGSYITKEQAADILAKANASNLQQTYSTTDITEKISGIDKVQAEKFVIYKGYLYYRYERTTLEERKILQEAGISCLMGDTNANGTLDNEDLTNIDMIMSWLDKACPIQSYFVGDINSDGWIDGGDYTIIHDEVVNNNAIIHVNVAIEDQIPEKMDILGLSRRFNIVFFGESVNITNYKEIMEEIPGLTVRDAKKLIIKEGLVYINSAAITEQEKTWLEEVSANVI